MVIWAEEVWVMVDTQQAILEVKFDKQTIMRLDNIAIGRNGAGFKQRQGDDVTPLGSYHIAWINPKSAFKIFYGFDYPSMDNAKHALQQGLLTTTNYNAIIQAHKKEQIPLQNSRIGGQLGIHGLGRANEFIHQTMNWTHGCIALTNQQIDQLKPWLQKGTRVEVK